MTAPCPAPATDIVVARHREDLRWIGNLPRPVRAVVYDKSGDPPPGATALPNHGREAHTYLHHLVTHYDHLAPVTVFCQGHPFDHAHDFHRFVRELAAGTRTVNAFQWLGFIIDTDDPRGHRLHRTWSKNPEQRELPLNELHAALFGEPAPELVRFYPGGQFAVTAAQARTRPRAFYEHALALSTAWPDPEPACCFERIWDRVFGVAGVDPAQLAGRDTVYLKPIRRLR